MSEQWPRKYFALGLTTNEDSSGVRRYARVSIFWTFDEHFQNRLTEQTVEAARQAWHSYSPAKIKLATSLAAKRYPLEVTTAHCSWRSHAAAADPPFNVHLHAGVGVHEYAKVVNRHLRRYHSTAILARWWRLWLSLTAVSAAPFDFSIHRDQLKAVGAYVARDVIDASLKLGLQMHDR